MGLFFSNEKTGYWIQHTHLLRSDEYECSECHSTSGKAYSKCPYCGAKMGRTKYDPSWVDEAEFMDMMDDE